MAQLAIKTRPTEEVLRSHLRYRNRGNIEGDLRNNYAREIVIIDRHKIYRGHDGVRHCAQILADSVGDARFVFDRIETEGRFGYLVWRAVRHTTVVKGIDSFVIEDGRITGQTVYYHGDKISGG